MLGLPVEQLKRIGGVRIEMNGPEWERLLDLHAFRQFLRIVVHDLGLDTRSSRAELHHAVERNCFVGHRIEDDAVRGRVTDRRSHHGGDILRVGHHGQLVTAARHQHGAAPHEAVKEVLLAVFVVSVACEVLRAERRERKRHGGELRLDLSVARGLLHRVSLEVGWGRGGLVHARRRHEEELLGTALLRERGDGADRVQILAVVVHDDIELRSSSLRGELTGVRPHGLDTSGRELVEVRERGLLHLLVVIGANRVQGNRVALRREGLREPKADVGVAATVGVDDEHLLGSDRGGDDRGYRTPGDACVATTGAANLTRA
mmetsp:Transcript_3704/g.13857  ORF Transcript_3704/g.13857 Transcript_3704/m.13857 type:complete len:318 (+) Transcript_3704:1567-2520(+)